MVHGARCLRSNNTCVKGQYLRKGHGQMTGRHFGRKTLSQTGTPAIINYSSAILKDIFFPYVSENAPYDVQNAVLRRMSG